MNLQKKDIRLLAGLQKAMEQTMVIIGPVGVVHGIMSMGNMVLLIKL